MFERDHYSLEELAKRWSILSQENITPQDIIYMGLKKQIDLKVIPYMLPPYLKTEFRESNRILAEDDIFDDSLKQSLTISQAELQRISLALKSQGAYLSNQIELQVNEADISWFCGSNSKRWRELELSLQRFLLVDTEVQRAKSTTSNDCPSQISLSYDTIVVSAKDVENYEVEHIPVMPKIVSTKPSQKTLNLIITVLKEELMAAKGVKKQDAFIYGLRKKYGDFKGISTSTLEAVFAASNKECADKLPVIQDRLK